MDQHGLIRRLAGPEVKRVRVPACPACDGCLVGRTLAGHCPGCGLAYDSSTTFAAVRVRWKARHVAARVAVMLLAVGASLFATVKVAAEGQAATLTGFLSVATLLAAGPIGGLILALMTKDGKLPRHLSPVFAAIGGVVALTMIVTATLVGAALVG